MDIRKDAALVLAGAVLGGIVTVVLDTVRDRSAPILVIVASLIILGWLTLLSMRTMGPLHLILSNPAGFRLHGEWNGSFRYPKDGDEVVVAETVQIRQRGRLVRGTSRSTSISGRFPLTSTSYTFSAALRADGILDGTWRNTVPGQRFHGSLQARIRRDGRLIVGTWIGVDENSINRGEFEWSRST